MMATVRMKCLSVAKKIVEEKPFCKIQSQKTNLLTNRNAGHTLKSICTYHFLLKTIENVHFFGTFKIGKYLKHYLKFRTIFWISLGYSVTIPYLIIYRIFNFPG